MSCWHNRACPSIRSQIWHRSVALPICSHVAHVQGHAHYPARLSCTCSVTRRACGDLAQIILEARHARPQPHHHPACCFRNLRRHHEMLARRMDVAEPPIQRVGRIQRRAASGLEHQRYRLHAGFVGVANGQPVERLLPTVPASLGATPALPWRVAWRGETGPPLSSLQPAITECAAQPPSGRH